MTPTRVPISPDVLNWTRERSGHNDETMRHKFSGWPHWLSGKRHPTVAQAEELASFTHVPFGLLLLPEPPDASLPIEDFRAGCAPQSRPSQNLLDVIYQSQRRQDWYREYAERNGIEPEGFLTRRSAPDPTAAAATIRRDLRFEVTDRTDLRGADAARKHLAQAFESVGGLVVISSMVGNSTHRLLDVDEFRGFTLMDEVAPLVFVNGADTKFGQIFSLALEFAHVARGESGVSAETATAGGPSVERWCNSVAAEVLVPMWDLIRQFDGDAPLTSELDRLSHHYVCSTLVVLLRLHDLDVLSRQVGDTPAGSLT